MRTTTGSGQPAAPIRDDLDDLASRRSPSTERGRACTDGHGPAGGRARPRATRACARWPRRVTASWSLLAAELYAVDGWFVMDGCWSAPRESRVAGAAAHWRSPGRRGGGVDEARPEAETDDVAGRGRRRSRAWR